MTWCCNCNKPRSVVRNISLVIHILTQATKNGSVTAKAWANMPTCVRLKRSAQLQQNCSTTKLYCNTLCCITVVRKPLDGCRRVRCWCKIDVSCNNGSELHVTMAIDVTLTYRSSAVNGRSAGHAHYGCSHVTLDWCLLVWNDIQRSHEVIGN